MTTYNAQDELNLIRVREPLSNNESNARTEETLQKLLTRSTPNKIVETAYTENISAGKNTYVYDAHTYHTKVPPQGIGLLIDYYTNPGEIVLDPFCGSGMTGVAALEHNRRAILSDLSPAATFIAENLCTPIDHQDFLLAATELVSELSELERSLYTTRCRECGADTKILYTVWSYGLTCSECNEEFLLWDVARDEKKNSRESKIKKEFDCPHCGAHLAKRSLKRTIRKPVQLGYKCCTKGAKEITAELNSTDLELLERLRNEELPADLWYPTTPFPEGVNTRQPIAAGIDTVDKCYTPRALRAMASLWKGANAHPDQSIRKKLLFTLTSLYQRVTVFSEFRFWGGSGNIANYSVPHIMNEQNVFSAFMRKAKTISWYFRDAPNLKRELHISTSSACNLKHIPDNGVDFIFTDPPFGSNINYSEMNFLWESWLNEFTDITDEAIVSKPQKKDANDYRVLLCRSFLEAHRVLRENGWMCVVFHNSSEAIWQALQQAITDAGFEVKGAQTFDKQHGTFKMFVSGNAVGYDLVLHCQKRELSAQPLAILPVTSLDAVSDFIRNKLNSGNTYEVSFMHVKRNSEFDYRRLYAEWLCESFSRTQITLNFEQFKMLVDGIRDNV